MQNIVFSQQYSVYIYIYIYTYTVYIYIHSIYIYTVYIVFSCHDCRFLLFPMLFALVCVRVRVCACARVVQASPEPSITRDSITPVADSSVITYIAVTFKCKKVI